MYRTEQYAQFLDRSHGASPQRLKITRRSCDPYAPHSKIVVMLTIALKVFPSPRKRGDIAMVDLKLQDRDQGAAENVQPELSCAGRVSPIGALSATTAHELNSPLTAAMVNAHACLQWLRRDPPDIAAATQAIERLIRDGERAIEIVQRTRVQIMIG
jgi:C4-dicarboxylate-specific signal transduction histidine kinase